MTDEQQPAGVFFVGDVGFQRANDGYVNVWRRNPDLPGITWPRYSIADTVDPNSWASAMATISHRGETAQSYDDAFQFHMGRSPWPMPTTAVVSSATTTVTVPATSTALFPHCDELVLHAPGECQYCDQYPARQQGRIARGINFTGHHDDGKATCPSEVRRPLETIERWPGNRP